MITHTFIAEKVLNYSMKNLPELQAETGNKKIS